MDNFLQTVSDNALLVYFLSFLLVFLQSAGLPLPSLTFALFAAMLAGQGYIQFLPAYLAVILGGTLGGPIGYGIGGRGGRPLLEKIGGKVRLTPERIDASTEEFRHRGKFLLSVSRMVPILPTFSGIFSGIIDMPKQIYLPFNALGIFLWATIQMPIAYFFRLAIQDFFAGISFTSGQIIVMGVIGLIGFLLYRRHRNAKIAKEEQAQKNEPDQQVETSQPELSQSESQQTGKITT